MSTVPRTIQVILLGVLCAVLTLGVLAQTTFAQPSYTINYQGKLTDNTGLAVANGTYDMEFKLYTQASGGAAIWTETRTGGNVVTVTNGLFSVMLGSVTSLGGVNFNQPLYLGVNIEADGEMTPRKLLGTVPSAFEAKQLGGVASTSFLRSDAADSASGLLTFTGGLISTASSTVARLSFLNATGTSLYIGGDRITEFAGTNLEVTGNSLGLSSTYLGQTSITTLGTITTGTWTGSVISSTYLDSTLITGGEIDTSAELAGLLSDETGFSSGALAVFSISPTITGTADFEAADFSGNVAFGADAYISSNGYTRMEDGLVGAPAHSFENDTNTGMWLGGSDILAFSTAGAQRMTIGATGNVGIGTTTPNQLFTVQGNINLSSVDGSIYFDDTKYIYASSTNDSVVFGENAGATFNSGTTHNVAIGFNAGRYASTSANDRNTFIGSYAGYNNIGGYNLLFGHEAGAGNHSGFYSNVFGYNAGYNNSGYEANLIGNNAGRNNTADYNNIFGSNAGYNNAGNNNNIIGNTAGYTNLGASNNLFGYNAGASNTGSNNNLLGEDAGSNNTGSSNNIFGLLAGYDNVGDRNNIFGELAGYNNNGDYNEMIGYRTGRYLRSTSTVAVGTEALYGPGSAYISLNNVALGYRAGYVSASGSGNNILIGYQAADNLTTGNNNIIIGYDIDNVTATADNRLNIGNLIFGTGLDGTGTTLASGNVGIGTSSPASKLSVAGDLRVTGAFQDSSGDAGTSGQVLLSTVTGTNWVATSSLGITAGASSLEDLTDVASMTENLGDLLYWNGSAWADIATSSLGLLSSSNNSITPDNILSTGQTDEYCLTYETGDTFEWQTCAAGGMAIGGSITSATEGSILFAGPSGVLAQDNTNFFFNDSTNRLTVGTATFGTTGFSFASAATSTIVNNNAYAFTIATSSTARPLFRIDTTTGGESVSIGTVGGDVFIGDVGSASDLVFEESSTISGQGTNTITLGISGDIFNVASGVKFGIASTSPWQEFSINGDLALTGRIYDSTASAGTNGMILQTTGSATRWVATSTLGFLTSSAFDTSAELAAILTDETGSAGGGLAVFSISPTITGTADFVAGDFSSTLTMSGSAANIALGSNFLSGDGGDEGVFVSSTGNVGIGSSSPATTLSVAGDTYVTGSIGIGVAVPAYSIDVSSAGGGISLNRTGGSESFIRLTVSGSNGGQVRGLAAGGLRFTNVTAGTEWMRISSTGNVGIGTTTPNQRLTIFRANDDAAIEFSATTSSLYKWTAGIDYSDAGKFKISSSSALGTNDRFVINGNGYVGIGTTSPFAKLSVAGTGAFDGNLTMTGSAANIILGSNYLNGDSGDEGLSIDTSGRATLSALSGSVSAQLTLQNTSSAAGSGNNLVFKSSTVDRVSLIQEIVDSNNSDFYISVRGSGSLTERFRIEANGNVGIGTSTPSEKLQVQGNLRVTGTIYDSSNDAGTNGQVLLATGSGLNWVATSSLGLSSTQLFTDGGATTYLTSSSDFLGIGTSTANQKLTVQGNINLSDANGAIYFDDTKYIYASSTNDSVVFGENAGATFTSGTTWNVAIGLDAGRYASTSGADYNVYLGREAGYNNTNWGNNLIGYGAGYNNTGEVNNLIGNSAGYNNTGNYNNIFGYYAGFSNTGSTNEIMGLDAGSENTGDDNQLIGLGSGYYNTGDGNSFLGLQTGRYNNGDFNSLIGYQTGEFLKATSTVAIGAEALYGYNSGATARAFSAINNTAVGYRAGYNATTTANNNILIGYQAADNLTTGNNNIIIGYDIDNVTATADNRLNIGNLLFGTGLDGTGTTLASGNIGIGTTTPVARLSSSLTSTNATADNLYSTYFAVSDTGAVASGIDNTYGQYIDLKRTGATDGTINSYAQYINAVGSQGGTSYLYGQYIVATGTDSVTGQYVNATGAGGTTYGAYYYTNTQDAGGSIRGIYNEVGDNTYASGNIYGTEQYIRLDGVTGTGYGNYQFLETNSFTDNANTTYGNYTEIYDSVNSTTSTDYVYGDYIDISHDGFAGGSFRTYGEYISVAGGTAGNGVATGLYIDVFGSDKNYAAIFADGDVGIGTTTPNQKLTIEGNINISSRTGSIYFDDTKYIYASSTNDSVVFGENAGATFTSGTTYNVAIGYEAGRYASTTNSDNNIFIGDFAGYSNTGDFSTILGSYAGYNNGGFDNAIIGSEAGYNMQGDSNVAIGYRAGYNTSNSFNVMIGREAGYSNTSGFSNVFIGYTTGYSNTSGYNNVFIGESAGVNNSQGSANLFAGYSAGNNNDTGYSNVYLGDVAGYSNTTGYRNVFLGVNSGRWSTTAHTNTYLGAFSGHYNQTGSGNTAVGYYAGEGTASNSYASSTLIGYQTGLSLTTGGQNILLGYRAGDAITTGTNNIILGYDIDNISATASNRLNIGNLIFGTGLDGTGTTLASGNVGIGSSSPMAKLTVTKTASSSTAGDMYGSYLSTTNTGAVSSGNDNTFGQYINFTRTGASGGNITSYGQYIQGTGSTGGSSELIGQSVELGGADALTGAEYGLTAGSASGDVVGTSVNISRNSTTGSSWTVGNYVDLADNGNFTTSNYMYGTYNYINKNNTASANSTVYGTYNAVYNQGSSATNITTGAYSSAGGTTSGTSEAFAYYADVSGADTNYMFYGSNSASAGTTLYGLYVDTGAGAGTEYAAILNGGNVGIGSSTPIAKLSTTLTSTNVTADRLYGNYIDVRDTGVVTTGTDRTLGSVINVSRTGATGGTVSASGQEIYVTGGTGTDYLTGSYVELTNASSTNEANAFEFYVDAGTNHTGTLAGINGYVEGNTTVADSIYGSTITVYDNGVVNSGTDTTIGSDVDVSRSGAGTGIMNNYALRATINGQSNGTITNYGGRFDVTGGTGGTSRNYGVYASVSGADTNYSGIFTGGNFGIGTTTPNQMLTIFKSGADAAIEFSTVSGANEKWTMGIDDSDAAKFKISSSSALGTNDRFVIDGAGKVGIGLSNPDSILTVKANVSLTKLFSVVGSNGIERVNVDQNGFVAITPNYNGSGSAFSITTAQMDAGANHILVNAATGGSSDSNLISLQDNSTGRFVVKTGGNVGIGDTTPDDLLNIHSASAQAALAITSLGTDTDSLIKFELADGTATFSMGVDDSDSDKFKISGSSLGTNDSLMIDGGSSSVGFGLQAGLNFNSLTTYNVALGPLAARFASTTNVDFGVFIGYQAGEHSTGANAIFLGLNSGRFSTGSNNYFIGEEAGLNSTGSGNIAIGYRAGNNLTSGSRNTVIGYDIDAASATANDTLNIGNFIFGTNFSGTGTTVSTAGKLGIGTTTPVSTLSIQGSLCVRSTGSCGTTAGTIYATTAAITDIDLAENYRALDMTIAAGELVALDEGEIATIKRAEYGDTVLGVISTAPGLLLGQEIQNSKPVALKGRIPVKVNMEGGEIEVGDAITLSSKAGIGTKATTTSYTVGIALEATDEDGTIEMFVQNQTYFSRDNQEKLAHLFMPIEEEPEDTLWARLTTLATNFVDGVLTVAGVRTSELCVEDESGEATCITKSQLDRLLDEANTPAASSASNSSDAPEPEPEQTPDSTPEEEPTPTAEPEVIPEPEETPETVAEAQPTE